jgi:UDP-N-acetylmuramate--alanine ligase
VKYVADKNEVADELYREVKPGDLVIALGAGDINASARKLVARIEAGDPR